MEAKDQMSEDPNIKGLFHDAAYRPLESVGLRAGGKTHALVLHLVYLAAKRFPDRVRVSFVDRNAQQVSEMLESCGLVVSVNGDELDGITPGNLRFSLLVISLPTNTTPHE